MNRRWGALAVGLSLAVPFLGGWDWFLREIDSVDEGNTLYHQREYAEALKKYDEAEQTQGSAPEIHFNRGATLAGQGNPKDAMEEYLKALSGADDTLKARNYYNMGNALLAQKKLSEAIDSYKRSLRLHPGDRDAIYNLELALRIKKQVEEEQKKQREQQKDKQEGQENQENQGNQDGQQGEDGENQEKQDGENQDQAENQDGQQQQGENDKQQAQDGKQGEEKQADKEQADGQQGEGDNKEQNGEDQQQAAQGQPNEQQGEEGEQQQAAAAAPLTEDQRDKLEQTLDALQDREKSFQMQRFFVPQNAPTMDEDW